MSNYSYKKIIKKPEDLGVGEGDYEKDFDALLAYAELLTNGGGDASNLDPGQTPGDSFFLPSTLTCETAGGKEVNRHFYVDNRTESSSSILSTLESVGQLVEELPKMFLTFTEIGPQKCKYAEKTIVSQAPNGSNIESKKSEYIKASEADGFRNINEMETFNIFDKSLKEKVPHFYVLTVGLFFTYMLFNLSLKKK